MTAKSLSSVAESTSNTVDPERRANDDELSAGFQSDLAVDGRLWGLAAEVRIGRFAELIANAVAFSSRRSNREGW
jgi:hypothetical protein